MATQAQITAVQQLYVSYLGRAADKAGLDFWSNAIANGTSTIESVATGLTLATEYTTAYGNLSNDALVDAVYTNVLGRTADAEGKAFWVAAFGNGTVKADTFVASLIQSLGTQDQATINNKTFVAQTYTDTVGDAYTPAGGTAVIADVDSTAASVNTALASIASGTLPGQVPGLGLIDQLHTTADAVTAYGTSLATSNATLDADNNGVVSSAEVTANYNDATGDRTAVSTKSTAVLTAEAGDYTTALATAKTAATASTVVGGADAVAAYDNAVTADTAASAAVDANAAASAAATAGLTTALSTSTTVTYATLSTAAGSPLTTVAEINTFLADSASPAAGRAALVTELNKVPTYGAEVVKAGDLGLTADKAADALTAATSTLNALAGGVGSDYIAAQTDLADATTLVADATAADAAVVAAKVFVDQYATLNKASADAVTALNTFETNNATKVDIHNLGTGAVSDTGVAAKSDVFFFGNKVVTANDGTIGTFGSGDSIVLGSSLTYNNGALTTGDNNKSEFFLIQKGSDVQLVVETEAYGSSDAVTTGVASAADHAAVITLTGVNVADLTVSNGVVSHVA